MVECRFLSSRRLRRSSWLVWIFFIQNVESFTPVRSFSLMQSLWARHADLKKISNSTTSS